MDNPFIAHQPSHEADTSLDTVAIEQPTGHVRRSTCDPASAYRAASMLDGLSIYAAVFNCSAGCPARPPTM